MTSESSTNPIGPSIASGKMSMGEIVYIIIMSIIFSLGFASKNLNPSVVSSLGAYLIKVFIYNIDLINLN